MGLLADPTKADPQQEYQARTRFLLVTAAAHAVAREADHSAMVVIVHPDAPDSVVIAAERDARLSAAVRVAVATGRHRGWRGATGVISHRLLVEMPQVVTDVAANGTERHYHLVGVHDREQLQAVVLWFTRHGAQSSAPAVAAYRRDSLATFYAELEDAVTESIERATRATLTG